jgi:hypothetical protein
MNFLLNEWTDELTSLKLDLYDLGNEPDSFKYNILATEALRLSMCICDLQRKLLTQESV